MQHIKRLFPLSFQPGPGIMAPAKNGAEKEKGHSAVNQVVSDQRICHEHS